MESHVHEEIKALPISDDPIVELGIMANTLIFECTFDSNNHSIEPFGDKSNEF